MVTRPGFSAVPMGLTQRTRRAVVLVADTVMALLLKSLPSPADAAQCSAEALSPHDKTPSGRAVGLHDRARPTTWARMQPHLSRKVWRGRIFCAAYVALPGPPMLCRVWRWRRASSARAAALDARRSRRRARSSFSASAIHAVTSLGSGSVEIEGSAFVVLMQDKVPAGDCAPSPVWTGN
jgi:hypothetical protein